MCERVNFVSHHFHTCFTMHHFTLMWNMGVKCMWKVVKNMWNTCENNTFSHVFSHDIFNTCILLVVFVPSYLRTHRIEGLISWLQLCWSKENLTSIHLFRKGYEISVLAMKFPRSPLRGLLFAALLAMCFAFHGISAMKEVRRGKDSNTNDGMEVAEKRSQPLRERRAVKENSTEAILQRLQDLERKWVC